MKTTTSRALRNLGIIGWGTCTVFAAAFVFITIVFDPCPEMRKRITDGASAIGAIIAASALGWSWFYQASLRGESKSDIEKLRLEISNLREELKSKNGN